jgi:GNAT superfamily N-acetyltransferase
MPPPPFVVFGLPRSRTAWLAAWLGLVSGAPVAHDAAIESDTIDGWLETVFRRVRGTCETGAVEAWPILRRAIPECRIVTVQRDVEAVARSLTDAGAVPPMDDLYRRAEALGVLALQPGVLSVTFADLADPRVCALVQEHCLGVPFNWQAWCEMAPRNVQLDMPARLARLAERTPAILTIRAELIERLANPAPFVSVGPERWTDVADACEALGSAHHAEASAGIEGPYRLNRVAMRQLADAGTLAAFIARVDGALAGYCLWQHENNIEAAAQPTMAQGPFYVDPAYKRHRLGYRLLTASRDAFAAAGYKVLRLHHTMHGRGARAGALYVSLGAAEYQREYVWKIGE